MTPMPSSSNKSRLHISGTLRKALMMTALAVVAFAVFASTLTHEFVWDDEHLILLDQRLTDDSSWTEMFQVDFFYHHDDKVKYGYYRPVVTLSYLLDSKIYGRSPAGFHMTNVLLHVACVLLVFLLGLRLFPNNEIQAAAGTLLFAVHPIHTENVAWISGRTDILAVLFILAALLLHTRARGTSRATNAIALILSCACLAGALLTKELAVAFPLLVIIWDRMVGRQGRIRCLVRSLPFVAVVGAYAAIRVVVLDVATGHIVGVSPHVWALTAAKTFWLYLGELVWPIPLAAHIENPWLLHPDWKWAAAALAGLVAIAIGVLLRRRRREGFLYLAFAASLVPMCNIIRISAPGEMGFPMAERFLYLPSVFFCLGLGFVLLRVIKTRWVGLALLAVLVIAAAVATVDRNRDWRTNQTFIASTLKSVPDSPIFNGMLAGDHLRAGRLQEAEAAYRRALSLYQDQTGNDHALFATGLSLTLVQRGQYTEALYIAAPLEEIFTENPTIAFIVGEAHRKLDNLDEAEGAFVRSLTIQSNYVPARISLALVTSSRGDHARALDMYRSILSFDSDLPIVHEAMGDMHRRMGNHKDATKEFERAIRLNPSNHVAHGALGSMAAVQQDFELAQEHLRKALEYKPDFHEATISLAMIQAELGNDEEAEQAMLSVLAADGKNKAALLNLAILYSQQGKLQTARRLLHTLIAVEPNNPRARGILERLGESGSSAQGNGSPDGL